MPAPAVIPALIVYSKIVVVKTLVITFCTKFNFSEKLTIRGFQFINWTSNSF